LPIKPENKDKYPDDWDETREATLKKYNNRCAFCGVENHTFGYRDENGKFIKVEEGCALDIAALDGYKIIEIVLTRAHLNQDETDNREENVKPLCQKCHNNLDAARRAQTRYMTKLKKERQEGQKFFPFKSNILKEPNECRKKKTKPNIRIFPSQ